MLTTVVETTGVKSPGMSLGASRRTKGAGSAVVCCVSVRVCSRRKVNFVSEMIAVLQDQHTTVTTDAAAAVDAPSAYSVFGKELAQDDGHRQETLTAAFK